MQKNKKSSFLRIIIGVIIIVVIGVLLSPKTNAPKRKFTTLLPTIVPIKTQTVVLTKKGFNPNKITAKQGEIIIWKNQSGINASVNSADYPTHKLYPFLNLGLFENNATLQLKIEDVGSFKYVNHLNPKEVGYITVTD